MALLPLAVGFEQGIHPAHGGAEGDRHPGREPGVDLDAAAGQGAFHRQKGVFEDRRGPHGLLPGREKGIGKMIDGRQLPGDAHRKIGAAVKTRQRPDATFAVQGASPLLLERHSQGGDTIVTGHHRPLAPHTPDYQGRN